MVEYKRYHVFAEDDQRISKEAEFDLYDTARQLPFPDLKGKRVLDVGACDGWWAIEFARRGADEVVAIDNSDNPYFDSYIEKSGCMNIKREILDVYKLSKRKVGTFDFCYCGAVLCHLDNPFKALSNIHSVMKTEGIFMLSTPVCDGILGDIKVPVATINDIQEMTFLWPNMGGGWHMLRSAGFKSLVASGTIVNKNIQTGYEYLMGVWVVRA